MKLQPKNGRVSANGGEADYICFGSGTRPLIILPGAGDGFRTVKGLALPMALFFHDFAEEYRVYMFSRRVDIPDGFTTADMADDLAAAMDALRISAANVLGVSQGGMITQQLALRHPEKVRKIVLAVTASRPNDIMRSVIPKWIEWSKEGKYEEIMLDTAERSYTGKYLEKSLRQNKWAGKLTKPKDYTRAIRIMESTLTHDVYDELPRITNPTLVIGAGKDRIVGVDASREMTAQIPHSKCFIYPDFSHGVYEQAPDFYERVRAFIAD